ncbi:MAG: YHS domain-containing protein [Nitrospira sp.]|nr:YHS domain-containing protein [Nitrospira sp.]
MATDPVCQMNVEERTAAEQSAYEGTTYYFCSPGCREAFEKDPGQYLPKTTDLLGRKIHPER